MKHRYLKDVTTLKYDADKCVGCRLCAGIGCPALSFENKKAVIDASRCTGCSVCAQVCNVKCIG